jgi:LysM repeat protein
MKLKRLLYYLLINIFVSACVTLALLQLWAWAQPGGGDQTSQLALVLTNVAANPNANVVLPTGSGVVIITRVVTAPPEAFTPYPTRGIVTYRVKEGDTLGGIAAYFGVSLEELMALNDMRDPNRVISGVDILIPPPPTETLTPTIGPTDTPSPTLTPRATTTPRPTATATGATPTPQLLISAVIGAGDLENERIEIKLTDGGELALSGWQITDGAGSTFTFPQFILRSGGQISVYTRAGEPSVTALYWGLAAPLWQRGKTATILDAQGNTRATFTIP